MKLCSTCDGTAVCDFCIHYAYNGLVENHAVYCYEGFCKLDRMQRDPGWGCENFVCFRWRPVEVMDA